jgi:hypothetical protein
MKKLLALGMVFIFSLSIILPDLSAKDLPKNKQKQEVKAEKRNTRESAKKAQKTKPVRHSKKVVKKPVRAKKQKK